MIRHVIRLEIVEQRQDLETSFTPSPHTTIDRSIFESLIILNSKLQRLLGILKPRVATPFHEQRLPRITNKH